MQDLEQEIHEIALEAGVRDKDARDLAREFGRRIRDLSRPEPSPDVLIRQNGSAYYIFLQSRNEELANQYLERQKPRANYELSSITQQDPYVKHTFTKSKRKEKESSPKGDSISEIFNNLPHEEQQDALEALEEMAKEG